MAYTLVQLVQQWLPPNRKSKNQIVVWSTRLGVSAGLHCVSESIVGCNARERKVLHGQPSSLGLVNTHRSTDVVRWTAKHSRSPLSLCSSRKAGAVAPPRAAITHHKDCMVRGVLSRCGSKDTFLTGYPESVLDGWVAKQETPELSRPSPVSAFLFQFSFFFSFLSVSDSTLPGWLVKEYESLNAWNYLTNSTQEEVCTWPHSQVGSATQVHPHHMSVCSFPYVVSLKLLK